MSKQIYPPKPFRENRRDVLIEMISELRLGLIVTAPDSDNIQAVHIPMLVKEVGDNFFLEGHVAKANPIWKTANERPALVVFQGPHAYVHPGWYETKKQNGEAVPTWNYISVQARGPLTIVDDPKWLRLHVDMLSQTMEEGQDEPWSISDAPDEYMTKMLGGIVGLRVEVKALEGTWKMSQNHPKANRTGAIDGLANSGLNGDAGVSDIMRALEAERQ